jgi:hypothetical protein
MHFGMIRKRRKHLHFTRTIHLRPFSKCACSTVPHNLQAMCPDRIFNSGGYTAVRSVMHLGMIPKWRKHKKNIQSNKLRPVVKCACSSGPQNVHAMCPDRNPNSGDDIDSRSVMHLGMIPKWRKHKKNIRSNKLRPFIKYACSSGPQNVHAMCPDRNPNSGDDTAARWVMHLGMIPELRKHQHYMRRTTCRHVIKCAYFTAPQNVHVKCPDRILNSGGYIAVRSVMHLGMMPKWKKQKNYIRSIKLRPLIKCACSTAPQNVQAM